MERQPDELAMVTKPLGVEATSQGTCRLLVQQVHRLQHMLHPSCQKLSANLS
jgi:hypothetical protein